MIFPKMCRLHQKIPLKLLQPKNLKKKFPQSAFSHLPHSTALFRHPICSSRCTKVPALYIKMSEMIYTFWLLHKLHIILLTLTGSAICFPNMVHLNREPELPSHFSKNTARLLRHRMPYRHLEIYKIPYYSNKRTQQIAVSLLLSHLMHLLPEKH